MQKPHGFSLIELAVVMTVMAILSTAALPGIIATARNKYGEKMVHDMMALHTAAEAHYHNQDAWPFSSNPAQTCSDMDQPSLFPLVKLQQHGYISSLLKDPFSNQPYLFSYQPVEGRCHLRISTPRNAKLSPLLDDLEMTLKLLRDPVCDEVGGLKACHFDFEEPKLAENLEIQVQEEVQEEVEEQVVPINNEVIRVNNEVIRVNNVVNTTNTTVVNHNNRIELLERLISNPSETPAGNNDTGWQNDFSDFEGDVDDRFTDLNEQINELEEALEENATPTRPESYVVTFQGRYGHCAPGYIVESCRRGVGAKDCTNLGDSASCQPNSSSNSGNQRCTMTCVR